jgi:hypothetical protein
LIALSRGKTGATATIARLKAGIVLTDQRVDHAKQDMFGFVADVERLPIWELNWFMLRHPDDRD